MFGKAPIRLLGILLGIYCIIWLKSIGSTPFKPFMFGTPFDIANAAAPFTGHCPVIDCGSAPSAVGFDAPLSLRPSPFDPSTLSPFTGSVEVPILSLVVYDICQPWYVVDTSMTYYLNRWSWNIHLSISCCLLRKISCICTRDSR